MAATTAQFRQPERDLITRVLQGDREVFYDLVRPYERCIFLTARSIVDNDADAEEVAQEAVLKAFQYLAKFRAECKFSSWLVQITINEARMRLRKYRPKLHESIDNPHKDEDGEYVPRDFADWREIPVQALQRKELREALTYALASLAPKYREVLVLRDVEKLNVAETAEILGITQANVKMRLLRARQNARRFGSRF